MVTGYADPGNSSTLGSRQSAPSQSPTSVPPGYSIHCKSLVTAAAARLAPSRHPPLSTPTPSLLPLDIIVRRRAGRT
ncbi:hypothetical protein E2C01_052618 [Portunus trituberculatus]|uniref:Uncharacterized protein n=1 Tax=Portunus trituberculatus TaxID=210409 RepID=A0A5B7GF45_PORTR|nr:hypothetical protein [Portunus trituberculatus]